MRDIDIFNAGDIKSALLGEVVNHERGQIALLKKQEDVVGDGGLGLTVFAMGGCVFVNLLAESPHAGPALSDVGKKGRLD